MNNSISFRQNIKSIFHQNLEDRKKILNSNELLRIDLHCHDYNSDIPDELWGRILRLPETWLKSEDLLKCLNSNNVDGFTITNHNNARSCWEMLDKGLDVLPAAEFTCKFPEYDVYVHVLTYGFTPDQEIFLNKKRHNIYKFMSYANEYDIPTVLPHPLYFYKRSGQPPLELFEKFALLFERFEVLNGQRDAWQNLLTLEWVESITEEKLHEYSRKYGFYPQDFCRHPYKKRITGGSDDHMGIFAGSNGTLIQVPDLEKKLTNFKVSELILDGLRHGELLPYGRLAEEEKLNIAFLDYFCQVGLKMEDPGLVRMFLHQGSLKDKLMCLVISNGMQELRRHKYTQKFLSAFHQAFSGKRPSFLTKRNVSKEFKPIIKKIDTLAKIKKEQPEELLDYVTNFVPEMFTQLNHILVKRIDESIVKNFSKSTISWKELIKTIEVPSHFRNFFTTDDKNVLNVGKLLDKLSFPTLISSILAASSLASTRVLYNGRTLLNQFSETIGKHKHPERILWLTDTFFDKNGVSTVLQLTLQEIQANNLPIDFLICDNEKEPEAHLHVLKPLTTFSVPEISEQEFRIPNILEIHKIFLEGAYDRVVCSTELLMGLCALFLKESFQIPIYFYMHTDWLEFFKKSTNLDRHELDRVRRLLRLFYQQFDRVFVLNKDHKKWLASTDMNIEKSKISITSHWADPVFKPLDKNKLELFPSFNSSDKIILYSGRISKEKGVFDLPQLHNDLIEHHPNIKFVIAGTGPDVNELKQQLPQATYLGWVNKEKMAELYSIADLTLLPSTFDTFGCVVLESMHCGCPVAAYDLKGPKEIITHNVDGILAKDFNSLKKKVNHYFSDYHYQESMKLKTIEKAQEYSSSRIMTQFLTEIGMKPRHINNLICV